MSDSKMKRVRAVKRCYFGRLYEPGDEFEVPVGTNPKSKCIVDLKDAPAAPPAVEEALATQTLSEASGDPGQKIRAALERLDPTDDDHWTKDGLPAMSVLEDLLNDKSVTRAMVHNADPGFNRELAAGR